MCNRHQLQFLGVLAIGVLAGCTAGEKRLEYLGDADFGYYKNVATQLDYPHIETETPPEVAFAEKPRTVLDLEKDEIHDVTLQEMIHLALANNSIIRTRDDNFAAGASYIANAPSVYDPSIQESGVLFGGRGIEAALAAFDTQFSSTMLWGRNETIQNNAFFAGGLAPGTTLVAETGAFTSQLSKQFGYGGQLSLNHNWNYFGSNVQGQLFPSTYSGLIQAQYRHPLLAGSGTEFTRIAGPITQSFSGLSGVNQGVVIARINHDITLAQFEVNVRNLLSDVENLYWELYLRYRIYDTTVTARNSALRTWREAKAKLDIGGVRNFKPADEAQARDRYFETRAQTQAALAAIYGFELRLRRIAGLPVNDGSILRPVDEPVTAQFVPEWYMCLTDALTRRAELRQQKWNIKSLQFQLKASKSLTRPRLDFVSGYQVNGFGDDLIQRRDADGLTAQGLRSAYETITQGNQTGWNLGVEFTMPIGLRSAHAQVRNVELRLAKARDVLATQEMEISHELANAFQNLATQYVTAESHFNRRRAAQRRVQFFQAEVRAGTQTLDLLLRAQASLADAEVAYFRALVAYNQAITDVHFRKGTLFAHNSVYLEESEWAEPAYRDAIRRAWARSHAFDAEHLRTEPEEFVTQGFYYEGDAVNIPDEVPQEADAAQPLDDTAPYEEFPPPIPPTAPLDSDVEFLPPLPVSPAETFAVEQTTNRQPFVLQLDDDAMAPAVENAVFFERE